MDMIFEPKHEALHTWEEKIPKVGGWTQIDVLYVAYNQL
jgi:hypothetical protein